MIANPKGIDRPIQEMQQLFIANLWTTSNCDFFHRVFKNERNGNTIPEILIDGTHHYEEVKFNDRKHVTSWFDVSDTTNSYDAGQINQDVGVFFAVNLKALYPTLTHRAVEEAHLDVQKQLLRMPSEFEITGIVTGEAAYGDYETSGLHDYNMQPWHVFRFNCNVKYLLNC